MAVCKLQLGRSYHHKSRLHEQRWRLDLVNSQRISLCQRITIHFPPRINRRLDEHNELTINSPR